jgi:hypothetical protein
MILTYNSIGSHGKFCVGTNLLEGVIGPSPCHEFVRLLGTSSSLHTLTVLGIGSRRLMLLPCPCFSRVAAFAWVPKTSANWFPLAYLWPSLEPTYLVLALSKSPSSGADQSTRLRMLGTIRPSVNHPYGSVPRTNRPTKRRSPSRQPRSRQIDKYCLLYTNCRSHVCLSSTTHLRIQPRKTWSYYLPAPFDTLPKVPILQRPLMMHSGKRA